MKSWPHAQASRFVKAAGIRWHVQQMGEGPVLVLLHGTGASTHSWRDLMPMLARHYCVIAADLPGHAFTDPVSAARSSICGMSDAVAGLLSALALTPDYCVGHSAGAVVLCQMAIDRHIAPRVIVSVNGAYLPLSGVAALLFSPFARLLGHTAWVPRVIARRAQTRDVARLIAGTGSKLPAEGIELYARLVRDPQHLAGALRMMGNWNLRKFERELHRLVVPLALLVAENDLTVPPRQALIVRQRVANAVIYRLAGLGHLAHEEAPALVTQEILRICA